jgi:ABC-type glutathione transport system ATPase component
MCKQYIEEIQQISEIIDKTIEELPEEPKDPMLLYKEILEAKQIRKQYKSLCDEPWPAMLTTLKEKIDSQTEVFANEDYVENVIAKIKNLEKDIIANKRELDSFQVIIKDHKKYSTEISKCNNEIEKVEKIIKESGKTKEDIVTKLSIKEKELEEFNQVLTDTLTDVATKRTILDDMIIYEEYQKYLSSIKDNQKHIKIAANKVKSLEQRIEGLKGLEIASKEAEVLSLEETVKSINEHAKVYLAKMFEEPISIGINCVKDKGKKGLRVQFNTKIEYRGYVYDDVEELSGGERQKCDIAFLFAVNDMIGAKILMLDECVNELDATANTEILTLIKEMCGHKMVLVVSHEAVRGIFDSEILFEG